MRHLLAALLLLPLAAACGEEFTHLRFDVLTHPPQPAALTRRLVRVYEGNAVAVQAVAMDGRDVMDDPPAIELHPCDPGIVGVAPAARDTGWFERDERDPERDAPAFAIWGVRAGRSCLRVFVSGRDRQRIDVEVLQQPARHTAL